MEREQTLGALLVLREASLWSCHRRTKAPTGWPTLLSSGEENLTWGMAPPPSPPLCAVDGRGTPCEPHRWSDTVGRVHRGCCVVKGIPSNGETQSLITVTSLLTWIFKLDSGQVPTLTRTKPWKQLFIKE